MGRVLLVPPTKLKGRCEIRNCLTTVAIEAYSGNSPPSTCTSHFGALGEAVVKSLKMHLRKVVGEARLTYEELRMTLAQVEACVNSRPLTPLPAPLDALEVLTPQHSLIGKPLTALLDSPDSDWPITLLRRCELCQKLTSHFWNRWSDEYLTTINRLSKWQDPTNDLKKATSCACETTPRLRLSVPSRG